MEGLGVIPKVSELTNLMVWHGHCAQEIGSCQNLCGFESSKQECAKRSSPNSQSGRHTRSVDGSSCIQQTGCQQQILADSSVRKISPAHHVHHSVKLPFGISSAPELFQKKRTKSLKVFKE